MFTSRGYFNPERGSWYWSHKTLQVLQGHLGGERLEGGGWFAVKVGKGEALSLPKGGNPLPPPGGPCPEFCHYSIIPSTVESSPGDTTTLYLQYSNPSTNSTLFSAMFPGALEGHRISSSDAITSSVRLICTDLTFLGLRFFTCNWE